MAAAVRAALYLRVSTGRQADNDLSIPDQRRGGFWRAQFCTEVARPTRFELVTSAFGGQFPKFAMSCGGLLIGEKCRVYDEIRLNIFTAA